MRPIDFALGGTSQIRSGPEPRQVKGDELSGYAGDWAPRGPAAARPDATAVTRVAAAAPVGASGTRAQIDAVLSEHVYLAEKPGDVVRVPGGGSYHVASDAELAPYKISNRLLSSSGSDFRSRAYIDDATGKMVIAFKGTNPSNLKDIANDIGQNFGLYAPYYSKAMAIGREIAKSSYADTVTFTGHSLGGGLAATAAITSGRPADTFNAAGVAVPTYLAARAEGLRAGVWHSGRVDNYDVPGQFLDILPLAQKPYGTTHILPVVLPPESKHWGAKEWAQAPIAFHGLDYVERGLAKAGY